MKIYGFTLVAILFCSALCSAESSDAFVSKMADKCLYSEIAKNKKIKQINDDDFFEGGVDDDKIFTDVKDVSGLSNSVEKSKNIHDSEDNFYYRFFDQSNFFGFVLGKEREKGKKIFICMDTNKPVFKYFGKEFIGVSLKAFQGKYKFSENVDVLLITNTPESTKLEVYFEGGVSVRAKYRFVDYNG